VTAARGCAGALTLFVCLAAGCAAHEPPASSSRFIKRGPPDDGLEASYDVPVAAAGGATAAGAAPVPLTPSVPVMPPTTPIPTPPVPTIEERDPSLASALGALQASRDVETHRAVAVRYWRLQVFDRAVQEFDQVLAIAPKDARAYDGRARVYRDWDVPEIALGDAYRAAALAPLSPEIQNTLATILYAVGDLDSARARFQLARALDGRAAYVWSNLCYLAFLDGEMDDAGQLCGTALALDPSLASARHNLALVQAARGRVDLAAALFDLDASAPRARYNLGIVHLSRGDYDLAADAFAFACREFRTPSDACARAAAARSQAWSSRRGARGQRP